MNEGLMFSKAPKKDAPATGLITGGNEKRRPGEGNKRQKQTQTP